jgi:hypothetical protein
MTRTTFRESDHQAWGAILWRRWERQNTIIRLCARTAGLLPGSRRHKQTQKNTILGCELPGADERSFCAGKYFETNHPPPESNDP